MLAVQPEALWTFLSDTDSLNRAIDLPTVKFTPVADPKEKGHFVAETKMLGTRVAYDEFPFDWVAPRFYTVERRFPGGPIAELRCGIRLAPDPGGTELQVFADVIPRSWVGSVVSWIQLRKKATESVVELAQAFERWTKEPEKELPPSPPPAGALHRDALEARLGELKAAGPVAKLRRHLETASDLEVVQMRPFLLADRWGEDRMQVLRLFLTATKAGLLDLCWSVLCPTCRVPNQTMATLSQMRSKAHCETCGVRYGADFAASVEARFAVNAAVREARKQVYCIGGPANTPEIAAQLRLAPGSTRREEISLRPGPYRVRCYQVPGIVSIEVAPSGAGTMAVRCDPGGVEVAAGPFRAGGMVLEASNPLGREALLVVERESWREGAATAALVTSLQDFRDQFPGEAVAPGEEIGIASLAVLFTDLKGSTGLYERLGDPKAFAFVQNHFRYLVEKVSNHKGGVVKTMGDAVMATFAGGRDALEAAIDMQRGWAAFRREHGDPAGASLRVGLHQGPAIAINNAGRLDYFGTTVNMAARVQAQSEGDDVVFTQAIEQDPEVQAYLESEGGRRETLTVSLKGLSGDHTLIRTRAMRR